MKCPTWLDKERLYRIIFLADTPAGKTYDVLLIIGILASIITAFVESMPSLSHPFQLTLEILEYVFAVIFTLDYAARLYCTRRPMQYALSFFGIIDLISTLPPYLAFIFPGARYMLLLRSIRFIRVFRVFRLFSFLNEGYLLLESLRRSFNKILVFFLFVLILVTCIGTLMSISAVPTGIVTATFIDETSKPVQHGCCPRCGHRARKNHRFCSQCGEKLV